MIVVNFKAYSESAGERGVKIAKICEKVALESKKEIIVCPQTPDLSLISKEVSIPVFSQHIDPVEPGSRTGHITLESVKRYVSGTLINHSEKRMKIADIDYIVKKCRKNGIKSIVCTNNVSVSMACSVLDPDYIAIEPPELIGGDISVTSASPEIVENAVKNIKKINPSVKVLCGAGIKTGEDVKKAIELGAEGVLLASGVVKAKDPEKVLMDLTHY
ncbi:triose-phosphate isomerase [bacterium]|nr:triose-phosphate isomerase [Methanomicrobia archaeon]MCD6148539.1 triose-phosphate isomerase [bacterium]HDM22174.1 triose-phosphate isomerase [Methanomicrobia archaeon]